MIGAGIEENGSKEVGRISVTGSYLLLRMHLLIKCSFDLLPVRIIL